MMITSIKRTRMLAVALLAALTAACSSHTYVPETSLSAQANLAYLQGDWQAAENYYEQITRRTPQDSTAWLRMGNMRLRQNDYMGALEAYETASGTEEGIDPKSHYNMATSYLMMARESLMKARANLPEEDVGQFVIDAKLAQVEQLMNGPVAGITMPASGVFR